MTKSEKLENIFPAFSDTVEGKKLAKQEYNRKYRIAHYDADLERKKKWRRENAERQKKYFKKYRTEHRDKRILYNKKWQESHKGYWSSRKKPCYTPEKLKIVKYAQNNGFKEKLINIYFGCQFCNSTKSLCIHHREYTTDIKDCLLLCRDCHITLHTKQREDDK